MSAVLAVQPTATLDDFLLDPLIHAELAAVIDRLINDLDHNLRFKVKEDRWDKKRIAVDGLTAADVILGEWRDYRP